MRLHDAGRPGQRETSIYRRFVSVSHQHSLAGAGKHVHKYKIWVLQATGYLEHFDIHAEAMQDKTAQDFVASLTILRLSWMISCPTNWEGHNGFGNLS